MTAAQGWVALGILMAFIGIILTLLVTLMSSLRVEFRAIAAGLGERIDRAQGVLGTRIESLEDRLATRIDSVEARLTTRLDSLEAGQAQLATRLERMESRFDGLEQSVQRLDRDVQAGPR